jgi:hypothetical protein
MNFFVFLTRGETGFCLCMCARKKVIRMQSSVYNFSPNPDTDVVVIVHTLELYGTKLVETDRRSSFLGQQQMWRVVVVVNFRFSSSVSAPVPTAAIDRWRLCSKCFFFCVCVTAVTDRERGSTSWRSQSCISGLDGCLV